MNHIDTAIFLRSEKVLIFGKGPSFNPVVDLPFGVKADIYCINQTALSVIWNGKYIPDLVVFNDVEPFCDLLDVDRFHTTFNVAFPFSIHRDEVPTDGHGPTIEAIAARHGMTPFMYDLNFHARQGFPDRDPFKAVTTYNVALAIALRHGAKEIYTNGIDGGQGRHPSFEKTYQKYAPNYDAQFEIERELLEKYGAKVTRI